MAAVDE
jgi:hypothetical protein